MRKQSLKDLAVLVGRILAKRWYDHLQEEKKAAADTKSDGTPAPSKAPAGTHPPQQATS